MDVAAKDRRRAKFLKAVYDAAEGQLFRYVDTKELATGLGLSDDEWLDSLQFWLKKGMLKGTIGPEAALTHAGQQEVEDWYRHPEKPTPHLPAFNLVMIGSMVNSQVQQGTIASHQTGDWGTHETEAIKAILAAYDQRADAEGLGHANAEELRAEMDTLRAQLRSPKPKRSVIVECLKSAKTILENAAGSALATALLPLVVQFLAGGG